jgi:hypothetical protein
MKNQIKETSIDNEKIYLRKDYFGWRVVNPVKIDGKINYKNLWLGNRKVIIFTIIWILIMGFIFYGVNEMISSCRDMAKNPCSYFKIDCSNVNIQKVITFQGGDKNGT